MRTYTEVKETVQKKGYRWFSNPLSINMIWDRKDYVADNKFTDELHICWIDKKGKEMILSIPATTGPGIRGSLDSPRTVSGITGTAIIQPGQYIASHEFIDSYKEFSKYPYFRQRKPMNYWRDGDKDAIWDKIQPELNVDNHTHCHVMSNPGTYGSGNVNNWSEGCMGSPEPEWKKILPIVRESVKLYGTFFTQTILESSDW